MSTQIETGQAYAPSSAQPSSRLMRWLIVAAVAALAVAAILAVTANGRSASSAEEVVNTAGLTKAEQARADRLAGLATANGPAVITPQSEYLEDTAIIPVDVEISGPGWVGQDAALDEAPAVEVFSPEAGRDEFIGRGLWTGPRGPLPPAPSSDTGSGIGAGQHQPR